MKIVTLYCDNMCNIQLVNNLVFHASTKHIEVHYHYVHEKVLARHVDLLYVSTEEQVANIFTKILGIEKLNMFKNMMGVQDYKMILRGSVEISSSTMIHWGDESSMPTTSLTHANVINGIQGLFVGGIQREFQDNSPKELTNILISRGLVHEIELILGVEPIAKTPYKMSMHEA